MLSVNHIQASAGSDKRYESVSFRHSELTCFDSVRSSDTILYLSKLAFVAALAESVDSNLLGIIHSHLHRAVCSPKGGKSMSLSNSGWERTPVKALHMK